MNVSGVRVRPALLGDHKAMCGLFDELDELHRQARPDMFRSFPPPARTCEQVARWLAGPRSTVLVAEDIERVLGLVVLLVRDPPAFAGAVSRQVVEVDNLVVRADRRGSGIGQMLLRASREWARKRGAIHLEVTVHTFNSGARRFYERFGFAPSVERLILAA